MNISYFYFYLSERLHTHVRLFDRNHRMLEFFSKRSDLPDSFTLSEIIGNALSAAISAPKLFTVNEMISYISVPVEEKICVIGPVSLCSNALNRLMIENLVIPEETVSRLFPAASERMIHMGVLLYNMFADDPLDEEECFRSNCEVIGGDRPRIEASNRIFELEEYGENHNPIDHEMREMNAIEIGSAYQLKKTWDEDYSGRIGMLSKDIERNAKYLCMINVALAARAAIRGGIPYEIAFSLSDAFCQQIDAVRSEKLSELGSLMQSIKLTFTNLVAQQNEKRPAAPQDSPLVTRAQNYIFSHLHGRLTVQEIADELGTHPNYLNRLFKRQTGMSVYKAISRAKTNLAIDMLTYSTHSYIQIANYLGFTSQSHFINAFRKQIGITPAQYRALYQKTQSEK